MGRSASVNLDDIRSAISALQAKGEAVTHRSVRGHLGAGSHSTIVQLMKQLNPDEIRADIGSLEIPDSLKIALLDHIKKSVRARTEEIALKLTSANLVKDDLLAECLKHADEISTIHTEQQKLIALNNESEVRYSLVERELAIERSANAKLHSDLLQSKVDLGRNQASTEIIEGLREELVCLRAELEKERGDRLKLAFELERCREILKMEEKTDELFQEGN